MIHPHSVSRFGMGLYYPLCKHSYRLRIFERGPRCSTLVFPSRHVWMGWSCGFHGLICRRLDFAHGFSWMMMDKYEVQRVSMGPSVEANCSRACKLGTVGAQVWDNEKACSADKIAVSVEGLLVT